MSETETAGSGYSGNPLTAMDADMAANPQPTFKLLRDEMPVLAIDMGGSSPGVLLSRKEEIDYALRHPEIFSSNMDAVDLKNKRPMIPLQIDPPEHKKFRKLLDPIFAPRKMAAMDRRSPSSSITSSTVSSNGVSWTSPRNSPSPSPPRSSSRSSACRSTSWTASSP